MLCDGTTRTVRSVSTRRLESARIAFELHDVVAHGLSAIAIQAEAAQAALRRDPGSASAALETIRSVAHEALEDMRRLLVMTRQDDDCSGRMPQPGLDQVDALVRRAQAGGQPVALVLEGEPHAIPASLGLAAYRVVQEALANAGRRPATVRIGWGKAALEVVVSDGGAGPRRSAGMRERVRLHGGELRAGPGRRGGYRVAASFPL
jgi:signal transduction histidine kinase